MRLAVTDVDYRDDEAIAACVEADGWTASAPVAEHVVRIDEVADYRPGAFYERELPCLLAVLRGVRADLVVVDGYVWLDPAGRRPGLGAHLHEALGGVPVVGVAKNPLVGAGGIPVLRGTSRRPLLVTAAGVPADEAAAAVRSMHGEHRIPTLLGRADRLARDA